MMGKDPDVEHVRVGQHRRGVPAHPAALLVGSVAVVGGWGHPWQPVALQRSELVLRQRLGWVEQRAVERGSSRARSTNGTW